MKAIVLLFTMLCSCGGAMRCTYPICLNRQYLGELLTIASNDLSCEQVDLVADPVGSNYGVHDRYEVRGCGWRAVYEDPTDDQLVATWELVEREVDPGPTDTGPADD